MLCEKTSVRKDQIMNACGIIMVIYGFIIIAMKIQELLTDTLTNPTLLILGPLFLVGGIVTVIRASKKGYYSNESKE